jgi:undecaprenyl diphosphate synthase
LGVEYLTVYAFSTENWKRPPEEVESIWELLDKYLRESIEKMERDNVRLRVMGDTSALPERLRFLIRDADDASHRSAGMQVNVCVNYGGRDEIVRAAERYARELCAETAAEGGSHGAGEPGGECGGELTGERFERYLFTSGVPDPDLLIRTGGEKRLSNFLLWQAAYAELYFTDILWPDFGERELERAIAEYRGRQRRFGGI